jgi:hypothetical protein
MLVILLLEMVPKCNDKVLPSVFKHQRVVMYLRKEMCLLDKFHSDMKCNAIECHWPSV